MPNGGALQAMPPGIGQTQSNPGTGVPSTTPGSNQSTSGFSPPFSVGKGKPGVFTDPRQLIAGGTTVDQSAAPTSPPTASPPAAGNIGGTGTLNGPGDGSNSSPLSAPGYDNQGSNPGVWPGAGQ